MKELYAALPHFGRLVLLALMVWREVRNEDPAVKLAVAYVAVTRAERPGKDWWGDSILAVLAAPKQFSSMTHPSDPQLTWFPREDAKWDTCLQAACAALFKLEPNPMPGATYYFSPPVTSPPKDWGVREYVGKLGVISFFK
jgi:spore germination cell wall hydrolase CwlJ-like protein